MTQKTMERRVTNLERRQGIGEGRFHVIIPDGDETFQTARTRYESDHTIESADQVILVRFVE